MSCCFFFVWGVAWFFVMFLLIWRTCFVDLLLLSVFPSFFVLAHVIFFSHLSLFTTQAMLKTHLPQSSSGAMGQG